MDYSEEFKKILYNSTKDIDIGNFEDIPKNAYEGFPEEKIDQIETDLIKNFNFYMSNFESAISDINIVNYKKIFIDFNKAEKNKLNKKERNKLKEITKMSRYPLPFDYNFLFSFGTPVSHYPKLYLDAVFIDNTLPDIQKIYALVGSDKQFVVCYNKTDKGVICAPDTFENLTTFLTPEITSNIELFIMEWVNILFFSELIKHPHRQNSYRFKN